MTSVPRALVYLLLTTALATLFPTALGQDGLEQMRDLLDRGYYNSAARVVGPAVVQEHPEDPVGHLLYSRALYLTGDLAGSRASLERARALGDLEEDAEFLHQAGLLAAAEGNLAEGFGLLRNAFLRSQDYEHAMDWGRVAWQAYELEEALTAYAAAAETSEGARSPWPHLNRGRLLSLLGRSEEALTAYRRAIEVFEQFDTGEARPSPAYVEAYFRIGEIYEAQGDSQGSSRHLQLALDHYRAALTGDPNYAPAIEAVDSLSRRLP